MSEANQEHLIIVGLGNPGMRYAGTRHNLGAMVVQSYGEKLGWPFKEERRFHARVAKGKVGEHILHLVLPSTYMNESGKVLKLYQGFYKNPVSSFVVAVDDVALPFGQVRLRGSGSSGGHNGLKSVQAMLGTQDYTRLRLGIGEPPPLFALEDYVLGTFTPQEAMNLPQFLAKAVAVLEQLPHTDVEAIMNQVNLKPPKVEPSREESKEKSI